LYALGEAHAAEKKKQRMQQQQRSSYITAATSEQLRNLLTEACWILSTLWWFTDVVLCLTSLHFASSDLVHGYTWYAIVEVLPTCGHSPAVGYKALHVSPLWAGAGIFWDASTCRPE
jgi:hypothetical protein